MVKIDLFEVDHVRNLTLSEWILHEVDANGLVQWILSRSSTTVKHNLAHSYCLPRSISDLKLQAGDSDAGFETFFPILSKALDYGPMKGSESLRSKISHWYSTESDSDFSIDNIITTPGASLANFLVIFALLSPGDHVIVQYPTYQQLYSLPTSLGIDVSLWETKNTESWKLDLDELRRLIRPNTKMIIIK